jgi:hypothetical protein
MIVYQNNYKDFKFSCIDMDYEIDSIVFSELSWQFKE